MALKESGEYRLLLFLVATGAPYGFTESVAYRLVFVRLLVERGTINEGVPRWRTPRQERQARPQPSPTSPVVGSRTPR
jgi:hypothetical protein